MTPDEFTEGDTRQRTNLPGQMRLVAVPAVGCDTGEVVTGPGTREVGHRIVFVDRAPHGVDKRSDGIVLGSSREETHTT